MPHIIAALCGTVYNLEWVMVSKRERQRRALAEAAAQVDMWHRWRSELAAVLEVAERGRGFTTTEIVLRPDESTIFKVPGTTLIEVQQGPAHWKGTSAGLSVPVGLGIWAQSSGNSGTIRQGPDQLKRTDMGIFYVTTQRVVFRGDLRTIECLFSELLATEFLDGSFQVSVSSRDRPVQFYYGPNLNAWVALRVNLALALSRGESESFARSIRSALAKHDKARPVSPLGSN